MNAHITMHRKFLPWTLLGLLALGLVLVPHPSFAQRFVDIRLRTEYYLNPDGSGKVKASKCGREYEESGKLKVRSREEASRLFAFKLAAVKDIKIEVRTTGWECQAFTGYFPSLTGGLKGINSVFFLHYGLHREGNGLRLKAEWPLLDAYLRGFFTGMKKAKGKDEQEKWIEKNQWRRRELYRSLYGWRLEEVIHLPGRVESVSNMRLEGQNTVRVLLGNWKLMATVRVTHQEHVLREAVAAKSLEPLRREAMKILFGADAPIEAVVAGPLEPLFDYAKEVAEAKAAFPAMLERLGLEEQAWNTTRIAHMPRPVSSPVKPAWVAVAAGEGHTVALKKNGTLWAWGNGFNGQLGIDTRGNLNVPTQIGKAADWHSVGAGQFSTLAIKADSTLWAWGRNEHSMEGFSTDRIWHVPTQVGAEKDWRAVAVGQYHTLALKKDGTLWAWGSNAYGMLGIGTGMRRSVPVQVGTDTDWSALAAGDGHTVALKSDGTLWAWGRSHYGQLGTGTKKNRSVPTRVGDATNWAAITAREYHSLALKSDGTLWAWGSNAYGQLGAEGAGTCDEFNCSLTPIQVGNASDWAAMDAGWNHSLALKSDGTLWTWGNNYFGQLGVGIGTNRSVPTRVGAATDWAALAAGNNHSLALKSDGDMWAWGENESGQLGIVAPKKK